MGARPREEDAIAGGREGDVRQHHLSDHARDWGERMPRVTLANLFAATGVVLVLAGLLLR